MVDYAAARQNMVNSQLRTNKIIDDRILAAMAEVPREVFVPQHLRGVAYVDEDIPLISGRYLMEPLVFARLLQAAAITASDAVADIGCGSGYSAAVMACLADVVVAVESDTALAEQAGAHLTKLEVDNVVVMQGDLRTGFPDQAPYDVIFIDGGVDAVPEALCDQLAEGGRLVAVVREGPGIGRATLVDRVHGTFARRVLFEAGVPMMPSFTSESDFVF